jgi:hypothetical protein
MSSGSPPGIDLTSGMCGLGRSTRVGLRLALKPKAALMGTVDGAWWPRSTDPLAEFPAMIAGIELLRGHVDRVAFNSIAWDDAPDRVVVGGALIELEGFRSLDRRTVSVSGPNWHRMVLMLIPPEAGEHAAVAAMARAACGDNTEQARQILILTGVDRAVDGDDRGRFQPGPRTGNRSGPVHRGAGRGGPAVRPRS